MHNDEPATRVLMKRLCRASAAESCVFQGTFADLAAVSTTRVSSQAAPTADELQLQWNVQGAEWRCSEQRALVADS